MNPMFQGLLAALVTPFDTTGALDTRSFKRLIDHVTAADGVSGLVVNGHAGEVTSLLPTERKKVVAEAVAHTPAGLPVVSGISAETPEEAVEHAKDAEEAGAQALLVLPPHVWLIGTDPDAPVPFFEAIDTSVEIPLIVFQYPAKWGARYDDPTLIELVDIPGIAAVKDASWEISDYEEDYRLLKRERPEIAVLSANDEHILTSFVIGADGALLGFGSLAAELIGPMLIATKDNDLKAARSFDDQLYPLTRVFYKTEPRARMHSRIKYALHHLGVIDTPFARQPLMPLDENERALVEEAVRLSGIA
jgi:4-hydroxy-tetrahydrodipicolinate synthase